MKKILLTIVVLTGIFSCTDDITGLNQNTKDATVVPAAYLFTNAQKNVVDQMVSTSVNFNVFRLFTQQWTETTYTDESNYDIGTRTIPDNHWAVMYRDVLRDLKESKSYLQLYEPATPAEEAENANRIAIVDILTAYSYSVLVDTFGDVPYTESLDIEAFPNPKYDDGETIYKDLIAKLTAASASLDSGYDSFGTADLVYGGNAGKWKLFANSLRLKLAINLDDVDHAYATTQALAAVADGVISSNSDNAALKYLSAQPNANPVFVDVVASGRNDFVPTSTVIEKMNGLNDPRRAKFFTQIGDIYEGGTPGSSNNFDNFSHIGDMLLEPTFEGLIMDNAEVEFLLAEAVERGIAVGGTSTSHYDAAITASMNYWGVSSEDIASYLAQPSVAYATATGNWKQKIGEQAYLGLYNRGFECWTSYRRLDFPVLTAPDDAEVNQVPTRYTYPAREETLNASNLEAASTAIGGNTLTTKLFWDVN
ncbi:SusD/RagB family nutrient-binding outer membrane lipoprotein [Flavobacterium paronense]|uniref:SusD/RagB family nutrient-binding outer membrane lipoprotein n=1 Tax=Flavobacterium paronense TaxID=1392775 RepID=A0ABV5GHD7_9FLAO|nr:SusD/RagB family nutrient-binding outer membrane lipoprotein [Flavobacterium paronense]MDN3676481.1 SusD/RagB family nutrient-binding outer membrane lipoprotein [Flavobacterium paronense]